MSGQRPDGLVLRGHWLGYGWGHGFGMWIPYRVKRMIVHTWNVVSCRILGHDTITQDKEGGPCVCVSCLGTAPDPGPDGDVLRIWAIPWEDFR